MANTRRKTLTPPTNPWERALEEQEGADRSQAGEFEAGDEEGGGGDKGIDADTGDGGYGGDAVLEGYDESTAQADRPVDREIHGDPRTHEGESYPDDAKALDPSQGTIGTQPIDDEEDRTEER
jgi:hypothetical protein